MSTTTQGTIEHIDPQALTVETNVRRDVTLDDAFLASIRSAGVLTPILGYRDQDGTVHVRAGQRRTRAAQHVGLATVPVYVIDAATDGAERIIEQLIENEHRTELTESDRIEAWKQLEFEGLSVAQIAKRTGTKRDRVKTGLTVAANDTSTALVAGGILLDFAATLIEFEDDPETHDTLAKEAIDNPDFFPVAVERARQERENEAKIAEATTIEEQKGHQILAERPDWGSTQYRTLSDLRTSDGRHVTAEDVQGKEGVHVYVSTNWQHEVTVSHYLTDHEAHGFTLSEYARQAAPKGPMTEEQKAERKTLIANNKEWDAAETVRRDWLTTFIARKTLPKNAATYIAQALSTNARRSIADSLTHGNELAAQILGLEPGTYTRNTIADYLEKHPARAQHVTLAIILGGIEANTGRDTWRNPSDHFATYFTTLADWGHTLSPVEKIAAQQDGTE